MKTLLGRKIKKVTVYKTSVSPYKKDKVFGSIWLEDEDLRIKIVGGKFYFVNKLGQTSGIVLKTNPAHKKIKRMISVRFKAYRKNNLRIKY